MRAQCLQAWPPIGCWHQLIPGSGPAITPQAVLLVTQCSQAGTLLCTAVQCSAVYSCTLQCTVRPGQCSDIQEMTIGHRLVHCTEYVCTLYIVYLQTVQSVQCTLYTCRLFRVLSVIVCTVQLLSPSSHSWEALLHFTMAVKGNLNYMAVRPRSSVIEMQILQCVVFSVQCVVRSVQYVVCSVQYVMCTVQGIVCIFIFILVYFSAQIQTRQAQ